MVFLLGLVSFYLLTWLVSVLTHSSQLSGNMRGVVAAAIMFMAVGIAHFAAAGKFEGVIPPSWPAKKAANYISGLAEIAGGLGLLFPATRIMAAWGLVILLVVIFPVNIYMATVNPGFNSIFRLFFQPVYIAWIWWFCVRAAA